MATIQYGLRLDKVIWRKAKAKAALEGITMKEALERMLTAWTEGRIEIHECVK